MRGTALHDRFVLAVAALFLCAHLAWLWAHRPTALRVYGSPDGGGDGGFIVATPPPAQPPWRLRVEPLSLTSP